MNDNLNIGMQQCFIEEAKELLEKTEQCFLDLERSQENPKILEQIFRLAHNLKGSAKAVGFEVLGGFTHDLETFLLAIKCGSITISKSIVSLLLRCNDILKISIEDLRLNAKAEFKGASLQKELRELLAGKNLMPLDTPNKSNNPGKETSPAKSQFVEFSEPEPNVPRQYTSRKMPERTISATPSHSEESIRVNLQKIDELINSVGELVIHQTVMNQQKFDTTNMLVRKTIDQMSKIVRNVQSLSMSLRMIPLKQTFQKMHRIVRDTSQTLGKEVDLVMLGEETEIDKTVLEQLSDPLVHLIRNAVDHGLEHADQRQARGKPARGKLILSAYQQAGSLVIEIKDDGKGIDPAAIRKKAETIGLITKSQNLSDSELQQLIFAPGFSTKEEVTDVSGRGVGMNVVKTNIAQLQGQIDIISKVDQGTLFRISLPLTMAIIEGVVVRLEDERFVIPLSQVTEFFRARSADVAYVRERQEVINLREDKVPAYRLSNLFKKRRISVSDPWDLTALIAKDLNQMPFAVLVDEVVSLQQVVIKPVGDEIKDQPELKGSAILGDGKPALIIDLVELTAPFRKIAEPN